ncbi:MAG: hypothetical protein CM1200mP26_30370 [Acidimicrobiales bacterium]|nr:MAG: hypothetical protein CM1200mP26_30370 [Acidimicrobiales bacterium]
MTATRALVVEITRGDRVESRHEVDVAVVDVEGRLVRAHGHAARDVMPRSAAKPIQALPYWALEPPTPLVWATSSWPWPARATTANLVTLKRYWPG